MRTYEGDGPASNEMKLLVCEIEQARGASLNGATVAKLSSYLGANASYWTCQNRARLRRILVACGRPAIASIVKTMWKLQRTDVLDECQLTLVQMGPDALPVLREMVGLVPECVAGCVAEVMRAAIARIEGSADDE